MAGFPVKLHESTLWSMSANDCKSLLSTGQLMAGPKRLQSLTLNPVTDVRKTSEAGRRPVLAAERAGPALTVIALSLNGLEKENCRLVRQT